MSLEERLLAAHAADDLARLIRLYQEASQRAVSEDVAAFFLTQAYVYALDLGDPAASGLRQALIARGRESAD